MDVSPKEFRHFPRLPAELRIIIWKDVLWTPNIMQLCFDPEHALDHIGQKRVVPPLLQACAESRMLSLEVYPERPYEKEFRGVIGYANFEIDTLYIPFDDLPGYTCNPLPILGLKSFDLLQRVKRMAINIRYCSSGRVFSVPMALPSFANLATLTFVIEDDSDANEPAKLIDLDERDEGRLIDLDTQDGPSQMTPRDLLANGSKMLDFIREQFHAFVFVPQPRLKKLVGKVPGEVVAPFKREPERVFF